MLQKACPEATFEANPATCPVQGPRRSNWWATPTSAGGDHDERVRFGARCADLELRSESAAESPLGAHRKTAREERGQLLFEQAGDADHAHRAERAADQNRARRSRLPAVPRFKAKKAKAHSRRRVARATATAGFSGGAGWTVEA